LAVDSFKYLPRVITAFYQATDREPQEPIPWTPIDRPLEQCRFALITSGGLYQLGKDPPFDLEREAEEPTWGDPTFRVIPTDIRPDQIGVSHLHIKTVGIREDFNILLPIHRFQRLVEEGRIGGLGRKAYSFMGYQGFPPDASEWVETYVPQVVEELRKDEVDCVFLTPA
jgi:D-proline reductase (dithiol) PrdB